MPDGTPRKISFLLVDDSRDYPVLVERAFGQVRRGVFVHSVASGQLALEHLLRCGERIPLPDLVLLDRHMPGGMDGFETLRAVRLVERLVAVHVLIVAGSDDPAHLDEARASGADGYIVKPSERDQWIGLAREILAWTPQDSWRSSGGMVSGMALATTERRVSSVTMNPANAATVDVSALPEENSLLRAVHFIRDMVVKTLDPVDFAISEACRKHHIPVAHARGRSQDQVTVANRHAVILDLMDQGWSDRVVGENFLVSARGVERLRAEWRRKRGGVLADRVN